MSKASEGWKDESGVLVSSKQCTSGQMRVPTARILNRGVSKKDEWTYLSLLVEDHEVGAQIALRPRVDGSCECGLARESRAGETGSYELLATGRR